MRSCSPGRSTIRRTRAFSHDRFLARVSLCWIRPSSSTSLSGLFRHLAHGTAPLNGHSAVYELVLLAASVMALVVLLFVALRPNPGTASYIGAGLAVSMPFLIALLPFLPAALLGF